MKLQLRIHFLKERLMLLPLCHLLFVHGLLWRTSHLNLRANLRAHLRAHSICSGHSCIHLSHHLWTQEPLIGAL